MNDPTPRWCYRFDNYRRAFEAGLIRRGEAWQTALDARNSMPHTYNFAVFEQVIADIRSTYLAAFEELYEYLLMRRMEMESRDVRRARV